MKYVIDSNVALKWVLAEPDSAKANQLRDDFRNGVHELLAPEVFEVEIALTGTWQSLDVLRLRRACER